MTIQGNDSNKEIAQFFNMTYGSFANSSAKDRFDNNPKLLPSVSNIGYFYLKYSRSYLSKNYGIPELGRVAFVIKPYTLDQMYWSNSQTWDQLIKINYLTGYILKDNIFLVVLP
jgi:hypothetical protein